MKKTVIFVLNCFILVKLSDAQVARTLRTSIPSPGPMPRPTPPPPQPTTTPPPAVSPPPQFDRTPKCYPETAKAYFLPAPPSSPKVTVLDHNWKDIPSSIKSNLKELPANADSNFKELYDVNNNFKEVPPNSVLASNIIANRPSFTPPPSPVTVLPDFMDDIPTVTKDKLSRLKDSDVKVCNTCANLMSKLPIFKFDQELLDGFLVGLGL